MKLTRAAAGWVALVALLAGGCSDSYVAPPPDPSAPTDRAGAEETALGTLGAVRQILTGDGEAATGEIAANEAVARQLEQAAANVRRIGIDRLQLRLLSATGQSDADGTWSASVELTWRFADYDSGTARRETRLSFSADGSELASIGGRDSAVPLWLAGPLTSRPVGESLVVATRPQDAGTVAPLVATATEQVRAVLDGRPSTVVEVPATTTALHRALGAGPGTYDAVAAVTAPVDGSFTDDAPIHVFLNRSVFDRLDPVAAQVVITHEMVHAVTRAPVRGGAPLWLVEGFADYVALREVELGLDRTAAQIAQQVRTDGVPSALPSDGALSTTAPHLGAQYEAAWLACVVLAEHAGEDALISVYDTVLSGGDLSRALREETGWSIADLTRAWQARLRTVAGS